MKLVRYGANMLATVVIGFALSRFIASLPYEFPPLPALIALVLCFYQSQDFPAMH